MSGEELKAADCPFCGAEMEPLNLGGSDHLSDFIHPGTVTDKQCLLSGQGFTGDQLAAWNRRHPLPEQPQEGEWEAIEARAWDWLQETFGAVKPAVELDYAPHQMVEAFHAGHAAHSPMSELQRMEPESGRLPDGTGLPMLRTEPAPVSAVPVGIPDAALRITVEITPDMDANAAGELILTYINDRERWGYMTHEFLRGDFREVGGLPALDVRTLCCGCYANTPGEGDKINWWRSDALGLDLYLHWDGDGTIIIQHADWTLENGDCKKSYEWEWVGEGHWSQGILPGYYEHAAIAIKAGTDETRSGSARQGESAGRETASPERNSHD